MHLIAWALILDLASVGKSIPARMAIMATTTSSSINVKPGPLRLRGEGSEFGRIFIGRTLNRTARLEEPDRDYRPFEDRATTSYRTIRPRLDSRFKAAKGLAWMTPSWR